MRRNLLTNYSHGRLGEQSAVVYLKSLGFCIVEKNYKTPVCEIDIVAKKRGVIYFIEVKYRANGWQGDGIDYITPKKYRQMLFSASVWLYDNHADGDYRISAIEVSGDDYLVTNFFDELDY